MLTRRWARRGRRPTALRDQRTKSAYIFSAICPARGVGAGLVLPRCNTQAMQWHLDEISALVTPGAHAVLIIDRAGWHTTGRLEIPSNITLMFLPPRAPELNPVENIWQFMRDNWLSNRIHELTDGFHAERVIGGGSASTTPSGPIRPSTVKRRPRPTGPVNLWI